MEVLVEAAVVLVFVQRVGGGPGAGGAEPKEEVDPTELVALLAATMGEEGG